MTLPYVNYIENRDAPQWSNVMIVYLYNDIRWQIIKLSDFTTHSERLQEEVMNYITHY